MNTCQGSKDVLHILMIHPHDIFSLSEPWTIRIVRLAQGLVKKGCKVRVVYFPLVFTDQKPYQDEYGVEFYALPRMVGAKTLWTNSRAVYRLAQWADIIHVQKCFYHAMIPALLAGYLLKRPIHYDWDDWETKIYHFGKPPSRLIGYYLAFMEYCIPRLVDSVSYSSEHLFAQLEKWGYRPSAHGKVPVGADQAFFEIHRENIKVKDFYAIAHPLVMYVGQLHGAQYAELFIRAAVLLVQKGIKAQYMIVGDGYMSAHLKSVARQLGIDQHLIFTGAVAHVQVPSFLSAADVAVACFEDNDITRSKSPLKIAEYLMAGKAIVATDIGEVRAMTNGAAYLVKNNEVHVLAEGIEKVLVNVSLRMSLEQKARLQSSYYTWDVSSQRLYGIYQKCIHTDRNR